MIATYFDTRYEDAEDFKASVVDSDSGGTRIDLGYWLHGKTTAINPELIIHMTEDHARQLHQKLEDYFTQKNVEALKARLNYATASEAAE